MTQKYENSSGDTGLFSNSQFLVSFQYYTPIYFSGCFILFAMSQVFVNRILAFGVALTYITLAPRRSLPTHTAPIYKYSFCSVSNILSSWCQYEALKFVSFPTQVLAKASKIIPVMAMGRVVSGKTYQVSSTCTQIQSIYYIHTANVRLFYQIDLINVIAYKSI